MAVKRPRGDNLRLTFVAALFIACVVAGFVKLTHVANKANDAAARSRAVAAESRHVARDSQRQIGANARTIRFLCDQSYVLVDVLEASLSAFNKTKAQHPSRPLDPAAVELFNRLDADRSALSNALSAEVSPCNVG